MTDDLDDGTDWTLLARYLSGEASAAERRQVEAWTAADPDRQEELAVLRRLWQQAGALPGPGRIDEMWSAVAREMNEPAPAATRPLPAPLPARRAPRAARLRTFVVRPVAAVAASALLALAGMAGYRELRGGGSDPAEQPRSYETARGHTARIRLADGTRVLLGPDSELRVAPFGATGPRDVELSGEAVFEVEHDAERPFVVRAAHAVTEDLGTEFAVRAYPGEGRVAVAVIEGRVALRSSGAPAHSGTILEPGQTGRLGTDGRVAVRSVADAPSFLGWTEGRLVFAQTPLREVIVELERWYDVELEIADSAIAAARITLDMPVGALSEVLDAVAVPLNLRYERTRDSIRLYR